MQARAYQSLLVSVDGGVVTVTLNRPERRNALSARMINELLYVLEDASEDDGIHCSVLTGAGSAFCAGADLGRPGVAADVSELPAKGGYDDLLRALAHTRKPIVARVNGHALGGGLGLVAASTLAIASTDAELGAPELKLGLFPFMIYAVLERVMPRRALVEMLLCSQRLQASEAASVGLVTRAVPPGELDAAVRAVTDSLAAASPKALQLGLAAMREVEELAFDAKLTCLAQRLAECLQTEDAREGISAFLEKRAPRWSGR